MYDANNLSKKLKTIYEMKEQGFSNEEIGEKVGMDACLVKVNYDLAKRKLSGLKMENPILNKFDRINLTSCLKRYENELAEKEKEMESINAQDELENLSEEIKNIKFIINALKSALE